MCQKSSGPLNHIAFIFLILSFLACALSYVAPFWVIYPHAFKSWKVDSVPELLPNMFSSGTNVSNSIGIAWKGMLGFCFSDLKCVWYWQNDFSQEKNLPDWYKSSQGVFSGAMISLLIAVLIQTFYGCCCGKSCCYSTVVASFAITGAILVGLALGLFGGFASKDGWFDNSASGGYVAKLDWAFYVGIGGAGGAFISSIMFYLDGCYTKRHYHGYVETSNKPAL